MSKHLNMPINHYIESKKRSVPFYIIRTIIIIIVLLILFQFSLLIVGILNFIYKYFIMKEKNLPSRGKNSYVMITGTSGGQGYYFAKEMAREVLI